MDVVERVELIVWSDYLCPWCYVGAVRLRRLEAEFGPRLAIEWRTYLLRPHPDPTRTLERFRAYTTSWTRPAAEADAPSFRVWSSDEGPPSHSVPPHLVAKAAATLGSAAFHAVHERLLRAYFEENRDVTNAEVLRALWRDVGLPDDAFVRAADQAVLRQVVDEHNDAVRRDVTGVPAVLMVGNDVPVMGAMPYETYRRWVARGLEGGVACPTSD
jgi:predicted DsbA family dithiol-disulfide isomerase